MIDKKHIGKEYAPVVVDVEKGQLRFFAKAVSETNPIYFDEAAAKAAGHPSLPAPPPFAFSLELAVPDPFEWLTEMGVDLGKVLHGGQTFEYSGQIYAGDTISLKRKITDIFDKKNGALEFVVTQTLIENQAGVQVGKAISTTVVRHA